MWDPKYTEYIYNLFRYLNRIKHNNINLKIIILLLYIFRSHESY